MHTIYPQRNISANSWRKKYEIYPISRHMAVVQIDPGANLEENKYLL